MKDIRIKIEKQTSKVFPDGDILGISMENLQGSIICYFDEFINGIAWLEVQMPDKTKGYFMMDKVDKTYVLPIKSSLLKQAGLINMQLRITQGENIEEIPVYKSNIFYCKVKESINSINEILDEYPEWIDIANAKLNEIDNLDISVEKIEKTAMITITRKDGSEEIVEIYDGDDYILTQEDKQEIVYTVKPMVETDIQPILENIENVATQAENIAKGKSSSVVKDTWAEMEEWLKDIANKGTHNVGDNLYIKAKYTDETMAERQPDYWIAEVLEIPNDKGYYYEISELEADKPDLTEYTKQDQFITLTQAEYDSLEEKSANTYYFIIEEE